jgi:hypothetical protein
LLRLWPASSAGTPIWRASLVNVHTGERHGFADLDCLLVYLNEQTAAAGRPANQPPPTTP